MQLCRTAASASDAELAAPAPGSRRMLRWQGLPFRSKPTRCTLDLPRLAAVCWRADLTPLHIAKLRFLDRALRRFSVLHAPSFLISRTQREPPAAVPICYVVAATGQGLASQGVYITACRPVFGLAWPLARRTCHENCRQRIVFVMVCRSRFVRALVSQCPELARTPSAHRDWLFGRQLDRLHGAHDRPEALRAMETAGRLREPFRRGRIARQYDGGQGDSRRIHAEH